MLQPMMFIRRYGEDDIQSLPPFNLLWLDRSVTRLGDFLHFGQLYKAFGNN